MCIAIAIGLFELLIIGAIGMCCFGLPVAILLALAFGLWKKK